MNHFRKQLDEAYRRNGDRPVAFIDESFRGPQESGRRFYILTAIVIASSAMDDLRTGIEDIAEDSYWHTVEALRSSRGRVKAEDMLHFLSEGDETCVVALKTAIDANDRDLEEARRGAMTTLLQNLQAGSARFEPVRLAIIERRKDQKDQRRDDATHRFMVRDGFLDRHFRLLQASPTHEHLLWLPDVVSSAIRQQVVRNQTGMVRIVRDSIVFV